MARFLRCLPRRPHDPREQPRRRQRSAAGMVGLSLVGFEAMVGSQEAPRWMRVLWCVLTGRRTLSSYVIADSRLYPLVPFATGCAVGALAVHFWAH